MHPDAYMKQIELSETHWWWRGRRRIIAAFLDRMDIADGADILEIGCGNGSNLATLAHYGAVYASDVSADMVDVAAARNVAKVAPGSLPNDIPFAERLFDVIVLLDVLEHLDDEVAALNALSKRLKKDGYLLVTVPAYQWLWSDLDDIAEHKRRYTVSRLRKVCADAGFEVEFSGYFNTLLFPLAAMVRGLGLKSERELKCPPAVLNAALSFIFSMELHLVAKTALPFGLSAVSICRRQR